jgi:hypothetical protein
MNLLDMILEARHPKREERKPGGLLGDRTLETLRVPQTMNTLNSGAREWDREMMGLLGSIMSVRPDVQEQGIEGLLGRLPLPSGIGIVKNPQWEKGAMEHFGTTYFPNETGYVMDKGKRLDLTGRHYATGYQKNAQGKYEPMPGQPDYLFGTRSVDHRELPDFVPEGGGAGMLNFMDQTGAVRYMPNVGVSVVDTNMPSRTQVETVVRDFRKAREPLNVDIDSTETGRNIASQEFARPTVDGVLEFLQKYIMHK